MKNKINFSEATKCVFPYTHVNFRLNGDLGCCYRSNALAHSSQMPMNEFWNSEAYKIFRKEMASGKRTRRCQSCWDIEDAGATSYRLDSLTQKNESYDYFSQNIQFDSDTGEMKSGASSVELRFSRVCQLQCRICRPQYSSQWFNAMREDTDFAELAKIWPSHYGELSQLVKNPEATLDVQGMLIFLKEHAPFLKKVNISGGEPLLDANHIKALEILEPYAENITLEYSSNFAHASFSQKEAMKKWRKFKFVDFKVSIDGDRQIAESVRHGLSIQKLEENISWFHDTFREDTNIILKLSTTVSIYNIHRLVETAEYFTNLGGYFHSSLVNAPEFLSAQVLPLEGKKQVSERLQRFLDETQELPASWTAVQDYWCEEKKIAQLGRIRKQFHIILTFLNARDESFRIKDLLVFDKKYCRSLGSPTLDEINPNFLFYIDHLNQAYV